MFLPRRYTNRQLTPEKVLAANVPREMHIRATSRRLMSAEIATSGTLKPGAGWVGGANIRGQSHRENQDGSGGSSDANNRVTA